MKEIFINGKFLCQRITGVQRYAIEITKELDKLCPPDIRFTIISPSKEYIINNIEYKNISIIYLKGKPNYYWEQWTLPRYCKKKKPYDLVNFCNIAPILYPGSCTIHDLAFIEAPKGYNWKFKSIYRLINRLNIKRYKHIFTVSNTMKSRIQDYYKISNVTVTYNGYEHMLGVEQIKPNIELPNRYYFAVGSMNPNKNFKAIIELAKQNPDDMFVISGGIDKVFKKDEMEKPKNVILTGYVKDEELFYLYSHCQAFLFSSVYEGFGIPPLEAYAVGCKNIICNDIPVLKELYDNVSFFTNFSNTINLKLFKEPISFSEKDSFLQKFSWKNSAFIIYQTLCGVL